MDMLNVSERLAGSANFNIHMARFACLLPERDRDRDRQTERGREADKKIKSRK